MLGAASPVRPGAEGTDGSGLGLLFHPDGDRRVPIDPHSDLVGVAKVDLIIVDGQTGVTKRLPNAGFPSLDVLLHVTMGAEHDVMAAGLKI